MASIVALLRRRRPPTLLHRSQLTASLALPEPAAAIDEGAWRAAETIEALEGLTFGDDAIVPPASIAASGHDDSPEPIISFT